MSLALLVALGDLKAQWDSLEPSAMPLLPIRWNDLIKEHEIGI
jgi:hypothetical protein